MAQVWPAHPGEHVHVFGAVQIPPLKQPELQTAATCIHQLPSVTAQIIIIQASYGSSP